MSEGSGLPQLNNVDHIVVINDDHPEENDDHSLSIDEAAKLYGVSPQTVRRRIRDRTYAAFQRPT